jgi:hypothetical protein
VDVNGTNPDLGLFESTLSAGGLAASGPIRKNRQPNASYLENPGSSKGNADLWISPVTALAATVGLAMQVDLRFLCDPVERETLAVGRANAIERGQFMRPERVDWPTQTGGRILRSSGHLHSRAHENRPRPIETPTRMRCRSRTISGEAGTPRVSDARRALFCNT